MRVTTVSGMRTSLTQMIGVDSLLSAETDASTRSFNRFGRLAWDRTAWPFVSRLTQIIPDLRVRSIDVGSGGTQAQELLQLRICSVTWTSELR